MEECLVAQRDTQFQSVLNCLYALVGPRFHALILVVSLPYNVKSVCYITLKETGREIFVKVSQEERGRDLITSMMWHTLITSLSWGFWVQLAAVHEPAVH